ncbi:MAG: NAD-dependent epimerase/dehydratase family protein [Pseudomonadota bacterium]
MTTLVTGAGGFLGGRIVDCLAARGEPVRGLDLSWPAPLPEGVEQVTGSILDAEILEQGCAGAEHVINAAAIAHLWSPGIFDFDRVNVVGLCRVLAAARRAGARVVHVSSYTTLLAQDTAPDTVLDGTAEIVPNRLTGPYPRSKRQAELALASAVGAGQWATTVLPTAPIGAGDVRLTPPAAMLRDLATGALPALLDCRLNLVDAEAVAAACLAARTEGVPGARYLVSGDDIEIGDLAEMVAARTGIAAPRRRVPYWMAKTAARIEAVISRLSKRPPRAPLTGVRLARLRPRFDASLARETLGFSPRPLEVCLEEALNDFRARDLIPR